MNSKVYLFILINVVIITSIQLIASLFPLFQNLENPGIDFLSKNVLLFLFVGVIIFPMIETLIFQAAIISLSLYLFNHIKQLNKNLIYIVSILLSAIAFGFYHNFSLGYLILGIIVGSIFALSYIFSLEKKWNPIFVVYSIHSLTNLAAYLLNNIFKL